jgi:hypothetical protein
MKERIFDYIMETVSKEDMMDYTEFELENLLKDVANHINNKSNLWVTEVSDGKYKLHINCKGIEKDVEVRAWDDKVTFAEDVYELFIMPNEK